MLGIGSILALGISLASLFSIGSSWWWRPLHSRSRQDAMQNAVDFRKLLTKAPVRKKTAEFAAASFATMEPAHGNIRSGQDTRLGQSGKDMRRQLEQSPATP